jgi:hypothetical protein
MDTARQVLRWAIPGWLLSVFASMFMTVRFVLSGHTLTVTDFAGRNYGTLLSLLTILAGLGIPIGYFVYQIYFWIYWSVPIPFLKSPADRGHSILKDCPADWAQLVGYSLDDEVRFEQGTLFRIGPFQLHIKDRNFLARYQHNWLLSDFVWYRTIILNGAEMLEKRVIFLTDTYHSLGASLVSLWIAFALYVTYDIAMHREPIAQGCWVYAWSILVNLGLLALLTVILRFNRASTLRTLVALRHDFITYFSRFPMDKGDNI